MHFVAVEKNCNYEKKVFSSFLQTFFAAFPYCTLKHYGFVIYGKWADFIV